MAEKLIGFRVSMKSVAFCSLFLVLIISSPSGAAERGIPFPKEGIVRKKSFKGYRVTHIPKVTYDIPPLLTREEAAKILPTASPSNSQESDMMLKRMGDRALGMWLKSSSMQNLSVVQTAQKVEQAMKAEVGFGGGESENGEKSIQHKINFQFQAFQATSKIDYSGFVNASVTYNLKDQIAGVEVREKVLENKDLFVNMSSSKTEDLGSVGIKWSF
jgi:hypothetical protein